MSIEAGTFYDSITYIKDGISQWTLLGPLNGDLVAGLVVGLVTLLKSIGLNQIPNEIINLVYNNGNRSIEIRLLDDDSYRLAVSDYYIYNSDIDEIIFQTYDIRPNIASFGWWIVDPNITKYELYSFQSSEFIQGFITIMNMFGVDFRNYILGPPFTYETNNKNPIYYTIEGYDIDSIPSPKKEAPVGAFYTAIYGADPNGEDFE